VDQGIKCGARAKGIYTRKSNGCLLGRPRNAFIDVPGGALPLQPDAAAISDQGP
jgi:hypothetical protein